MDAHSHLCNSNLKLRTSIIIIITENSRVMTKTPFACSQWRISLQLGISCHLLKQIQQTMTDNSWRVWYMVASHFNKVCMFSVPTLTALFKGQSVFSLWGHQHGACLQRVHRALHPRITRQRYGLQLQVKF